MNRALATSFYSRVAKDRIATALSELAPMYNAQFAAFLSGNPPFLGLHEPVSLCKHYIVRLSLQY